MQLYNQQILIKLTNNVYSLLTLTFFISRILIPKRENSSNWKNIAINFETFATANSGGP